ncbi:hypothetical protein KNE206_30870 [Kitasatospora sp. NE20-6]|uniref:ATP-binding protein n=1 Tax=Kitasatospora sp. NE20-6 TaxID=2859066 RepID=UPI0034DB8F54
MTTVAHPRPACRRLEPPTALPTANAPAPGPAPTDGGLEEPFTDRLQCVADIRAHARTYLIRARLPRTVREDTLLVVSELVTNSILHTRGPGTLHLTGGPDGIEVSVSDTSRLMPLPRVTTTDTAIDGRGLALVTALCDTVSVTLDAGSGKTVHAHLAPPAPAQPTAPPRPGAGNGLPRD